MSENAMQADTNAAKALAEWKALFATEVARHAKALVKTGDQPTVITLNQYRAAAQLALKSLAAAIQDHGSQDGHQEAA